MSSTPVRFFMVLAIAAALVPVSAFAETHTVVIQFFQFKPQTIDVKQGDEVEFFNRDLLEHTATASNNAFDSKAIKGGQSWKWKAGDPGQYPYVCAFHSNMKGVINVKP